MDLACACDVRFPLPVEEKALSGLSQKALGVLGGSARDGLFTLSVEEKAIPKLPRKVPHRARRIMRGRPKEHFSSTGTRKRQTSIRVGVLAMVFYPCLSMKQGKGLVERLAMDFSPCLSTKRLFQSSSMDFHPCLSRKNPFQGSPEVLAMAFSPCLSRKRKC